MQDTNQYYNIDPNYRQQTNIYFMESTINTKDNIWDIFEFSEKDTPIFEHYISQNINEGIPNTTPVKDKKYVSIYFR